MNPIYYFFIGPKVTEEILEPQESCSYDILQVALAPRLRGGDKFGEKPCETDPHLAVVNSLNHKDTLYA
jgi:hypothetical protein